MESTRLRFEKFQAGDFAQYYQLAGSKAVMRYITGVAVSREEALKNFDRIIATNLAHEEVGIYLITDKVTNQFIGLGKIVMITGSEAEIGYSMLPIFWGQGFGSEISEQLIHYSRSVSHIKSLMAIIDPKNIASRKILLKGKFKLDRVGEWEGLPAEYYKLIF